MKLVLALSLQMGCAELQARREIQRGSEYYALRDYENAARAFEAALAMEVEGDVTLYATNNAGMAYSKLFAKPGEGEGEDQRQEYAKKAALYLRAYLRMEPGDRDVQKHLSQLWIDSQQIEEAEAFWQEVLAKDAQNTGVLLELADLNVQSERPDKAVEWFFKAVDAESEPLRKVETYRRIAGFEISRLTRSELADGERIAAADTGLMALERARALAPDNIDLYRLYALVYQLRSRAHYAVWAELADLARARHYQVKHHKMASLAAKKAKVESSATQKQPQPSPSGGKNSE